MHLRHLLVKLLKLNKRPGVLHFSAVKRPGVCRLAHSETTKEYGWNKCICNCRWRKENTKQLAATMHADYCHMLLIYEQCLLWQRCLIFIAFELPISWSRSWLILWRNLLKFGNWMLLFATVSPLMTTNVLRGEYL